MSKFTKATRKRAYLKLGITGPAGSVKTYSAPLLSGCHELKDGLDPYR
jgi:hypothetical protein